jgi:hypothetical protein
LNYLRIGLGRADMKISSNPKIRGLPIVCASLCAHLTKKIFEIFAQNFSLQHKRPMFQILPAVLLPDDLVKYFWHYKHIF